MGMYAQTLMPDRTFPSDMANMMADGGSSICTDLTFDAICQHVVYGEVKTFAFVGKIYMELTAYGLAPVS